MRIQMNCQALVGGRTYAEGEVAEMPDPEAKRLLAEGAATVAAAEVRTAVERPALRNAAEKAVKPIVGG